MTDQAIARNTDPESSHIAADAMEDSGRREGHEEIILAGLRNRGCDYPPKIKQLARLIDLTPLQISRRVAGMREQHLIHTRTGEGRNKEMRIHLGPDPDRPAKWTAPCSAEAEAVQILSTVAEYMRPMLNVITTYSQDMGRYDMSVKTGEVGWNYEIALIVVTALKAKLNNGMYLPEDLHQEKAWRS
jgi:hypothetical protein